MKICDELERVLSEGATCEETDRGAKVITHCLYPSFEPVEVFVTKIGDGYRIHDDAGAKASAWMHGRDEIGKILSREAARFGINVRDGYLEAEVSSIDWLKAAVLAVANASAVSATVSLEKTAVASERVLGERILETLKKFIPSSRIAIDYEHRGASGKRWRYDFCATGQDKMVLLNAVTPHHVSISAKYVAFADLPANDEISKFAVFGRKLETSDATLITQVADLVPVESLDVGIRRSALLA